MRMRTASQLVLLLIGGLLLTYIRGRPEKNPGVAQDGYEAVCSLGDCDASPAPSRAALPVLSEAEACGDVGYLCSDLEDHPSFQILRWPSDTDRIRVRVPLPQNEEDPDVARALQRAAALGVKKWDGNPFTIVTDTRRRSQEPADIVLEWSNNLGMGRLGVTRRQLESNGGRSTLRVFQLALATRSPRDRSRKLDPNQVFLTAAHEMGHALGLPHSNEARDVMFPTNTARALTNRDYRTVTALYATPNGAEIRRNR